MFFKLFIRNLKNRMSWLLFCIIYYVCVVRSGFIIKLYGTSMVMDICLNCDSNIYNDKSRIKIDGYIDNELNQKWDLNILQPLNMDESGYQIQSKNNGLCVTFGAYKDNNNETSDKLWLDDCEITNSQIWMYKHNQLKVPDYKKHDIYHIKNKCLQVNDMDNTIRVAPCDINDSYQIWNIARLNTSTTQTISPTNNPTPTGMPTNITYSPIITTHSDNMDLIDLDTESEVINKEQKLILIITVPASIVILYLILIIVLMVHNTKLLKTKLPMVPNNSNTENKHNKNEHEYNKSNSTIIIANEWSDMKLPVHNNHKQNDSISATIESGIEGAIVHIRDIKQPYQINMNENSKSETDNDEGSTNGTNTPVINVATKKV